MQCCWKHYSVQAERLFWRKLILVWFWIREPWALQVKVKGLCFIIPMRLIKTQQWTLRETALSFCRGMMRVRGRSCVCSTALKNTISQKHSEAAVNLKGTDISRWPGTGLTPRIKQRRYSYKRALTDHRALTTSQIHNLIFGDTKFPHEGTSLCGKVPMLICERSDLPLLNVQCL